MEGRGENCQNQTQREAKFSTNVYPRNVVLIRGIIYSRNNYPLRSTNYLVRIVEIILPCYRYKPGSLPIDSRQIINAYFFLCRYYIYTRVNVEY